MVSRIAGAIGEMVECLPDAPSDRALILPKQAVGEGFDARPVDALQALIDEWAEEEGARPLAVRVGDEPAPLRDRH